MLKTHMDTLSNLDKYIIDAIQDRKGQKITLVDLEHIPSAAAPMFIIAQGSSRMNVAAIADNIRERLLEDHRIKPYNYDGYGADEWIIIDYGSVMVHIFMPETRLRYNLEELWSDAVITEVPDLD